MAASEGKLFTIGLNSAYTASVTKNSLTIHNGGNVVERVDATDVATAYAVSSTGATRFRADVGTLARLMDVN